MKIIFVFLKLIQLAFAITIIVACFTSCDIKRKGEDSPWLSRYRQYDINNQQLLYEQTLEMYDSKISGISFKIIFACVGMASATILVVLISMACKFCKKSTPCVLAFDALIYVLALAVWVPFTFCFLWMVLVSWSENLILASYTRPVSWVAAVGSAVCLTCFMCLDLLLLILTNGRRFTSAASPKYSAVSRPSDYYSGTTNNRHPRLAVSLNSVDLDADCENIKVL